MRTRDIFSIVGPIWSFVSDVQATASIPQQPLDAWGLGHPVSEDAGCKVSKVSRYDMARGRDTVYFSDSPFDDFEWPRIEPMNSTAGEQWEFDGISDDGMEAFCFGFYRDPNYSFFGTGNLRAYIEFSFANGSRYAVVDYAEESTITSCLGQGTWGTWSGDDWSYTFQISADMSRAKISIDNPEMKGTVTMKSVTSPRYADNKAWPSDDAELLTVPYFYWTEPIPVANLVVDAVIKGDRVEWSGMGGHERLWGAFNWYTCLQGMTAIRFRAGKYALSFVQFDSGRVKGLRVAAIVLAEDGKTVFDTRLLEPSGDADYVEVVKLYGGNGATTTALADKVTGFDILLVSPIRQEKWKFTVTHKNVAFEYFLGQGDGGTAYSGQVIGGKIDSEQFMGPVFTEIMRFPERSMLMTSNYS